MQVRKLAGALAAVEALLGSMVVAGAVLAGAVVAGAAGAAVSGAGPVGAAAPTGRLTFVTPVRLVDTRSGSGPAAGSSTVLPAGLLTVTVVTHGTAGSADVVACGNGADGEPTFHWSASDVTLVRTVNAVNAGPGWCLVTATAIDLIVDRVALLDAAPIDGGLQYRPLAETDLAFLDWVSSVTGWTTTVARPASVPNGAAGATLLVEAVGSGAGSVQVFGCTHTPTTSELGFAEGYSSNVVNVALASGEPLCVRVYGSAIVSLSVLGTLTASGPDPTRLPPTVTSRMQTTPPPGFLPVAPLRVLDTRASSKLVPGDRLVLDMAPFIDVGTTAVTMNITVTATEDAGFLTVWPCDQDRPDASNLNFVARQDVPNLVNVPLAYDGTVCFASSASTDVIADLAGTYAMGRGSLSTAMTPTRILDSRVPIGVGRVGPLRAGADPLVLQVSGTGGIPATGVTAVTMNVTVSNPSSAGYLTVWPCDEPRPEVSNLNFISHRDVPNLVTVKLSASGTACFAATETTDVIADAAQWFSAGSDSGYVAVSPERILDTRGPVGTPTAGKVTAGAPLELAVAGHGGIPGAGVTSVTMNVTVAGPDGDGYMTVWPCDQPRPEASNLNFVKGRDVPNLVTVKLSTSGSVCLLPTAATHVLADVAGYTTAVTETEWGVDFA